MPFHQQHFHDTFKLWEILHGKKITAAENKLRKKSQHTTTHTFILTTIFFNRWYIVCHIKSQAPALKPSDENKS